MNTALFRQIDGVNLLTLGSVPLSLFAVIFSVEGYYEAAILCILYAGCFDLFDGFLARRLTRTAEQKNLGTRLDSLVDTCSFGFAPIVFGYSFGMRNWFSISVLALYLLATVARVAYFDSTGFYKIGNTEYYVGLPVTFAALFFPNVFVLNFFVEKRIMLMILTLIFLGMGIAMVAGFRIAKHNPTRQGLPRRFIVLPVGALMLTIIYGCAMFS